MELQKCLSCGLLVICTLTAQLGGCTTERATATATATSPVSNNSPSLPDGSMTRGEFANTLQQHFSLQAPLRPMTFVDIASTDPNLAAIQAAAPYMNGQIFCPGCVLVRSFDKDQPVSRALASVAVVRIMAARGQLQIASAAEADKVLAGTDAGQVLPALARRFIATAVSHSILTSSDPHLLRVDRPMLRSDLSKTLSHLPVAPQQPRQPTS
jgi:hypothetical protein